MKKDFSIKELISKPSYSELLKDPRWQKKRLEIMMRDKFTCKLCGDTETTLHIHHKEYINGNNPWEYDDLTLITVCENCHTVIEFYKKHEIDICHSKILKVARKDSNKINFDILFFIEMGFEFKFVQMSIDNNIMSCFGLAGNDVDNLYSFILKIKNNE